ncbi:hypothetical protein HAX54_033038, partial [Datura stramonium]|nr:hypothetical protein [Datura stramonium]
RSHYSGQSVAVVALEVASTVHYGGILTVTTSLEVIDDGSHCDYTLSGFLYALNVWALEVFPSFSCYSHHMDRRVTHILSWAPVKQTPYGIIIDKFFHAEHRFKSFQVSALVATDKERQHFPVPLQFDSDSACSSSSVGSLISCALFDQLVDKLKSRFDEVECHVGELDDKFGDVINIVESLLHTYEENKLEKVVVECSRKAVSVQDKSTSTPNIDACCMPTEVLDHLYVKTEPVSQVELDLAMGVATTHAKEATMRTKKHALYSAQLEYKLEEVVERARKSVEVHLAMKAAAVHAEEAAMRAQKSVSV